MALRLHNTLTRTKQDFVPIDAANVRMYVCGPTVYDFAHIGNARPLIVFDVLFRLLRHLYGEEHVTYVRNITDVDDKINARAAAEYPELPLNDAIRAVTEKTTAQFHADVDALGCLRPTHEPRATDYVEREAASTDMIRLIADLIANGHAYVAEGHVLFHVPSMPDYGKLSNRTLDDMIAGARVEVAPYKKDPMDFVLWKPSKPGEPAWPSPWSNGRPGWHIECSAMAGALLGDTFDIHGGGIDLIFPHHENEIAQSRCAHGTAAMANYWLHNGFLQVEGEKMSKSAGNFVTIRELLGQWAGSAIRMQMLMTHYRQPTDWTRERCVEATKELGSWVSIMLQSPSEIDGYNRAAKRMGLVPSPELVGALCDDLNTPEAISFLRGQYQRARSTQSAGHLIQFQRDCEFLGLLRHDQLAVHFSPVVGKGAAHASGKFYEEVQLLRVAIANNLNDLRAEVLRKLSVAGIGADIASDGYVTLVPLSEEARRQETRVAHLLAARAAARAAKNFAEADRIRAELEGMGIALKDAKDPKTGELVTTWEVKR
jgi:cysteinyl-tRNA synthetase